MREFYSFILRIELAEPYMILDYTRRMRILSETIRRSVY